MLGEKIKRIRIWKNLSQVELAEKVGLSRQTISYYEKGEHFPTIDIVVKLAEALEISPMLLIGDMLEPPKEFISEELLEQLNKSIRYFGWEFKIVYNQDNIPICIVPVSSMLNMDDVNK